MTPDELDAIEAEIVEGDESVDDLAAIIAALREAWAEVERLHSWTGLLSLLDEHWPAELFPTLADNPARDTGPRLVSALRRAENAEAAIARVWAIDPEDHATKSRDYGRGFADAIRLVRASLGGDA